MHLLLLQAEVKVVDLCFIAGSGDDVFGEGLDLVERGVGSLEIVYFEEGRRIEKESLQFLKMINHKQEIKEKVED